MVPKTPLPWCLSDSFPQYLHRDAGGVIDFDAPVARFVHVDDARFVARAVDCHHDMLRALKALRSFLPIGLASTAFPGSADAANQELWAAKALMDDVIARAERSS